MITRLAHVCIGAADLAAAEEFYVQKLGLELAFEFFRAGQRIGFYVRLGEGTFIEIFADPEAQDPARPRIKHFCLEVEDLDAVIARLSQQGVDITEKKLGGDNAWQAWIVDPSGLRIELMQYRRDSTQFTGDAVILA
ncbi:MAG: VOC family protein [Chloroflexi bacterium]|nr:VOC family protein [Chloroflexota bacterium]